MSPVVTAGYDAGELLYCTVSAPAVPRNPDITRRRDVKRLLSIDFLSVDLWSFVMQPQIPTCARKKSTPMGNNPGATFVHDRVAPSSFSRQRGEDDKSPIQLASLICPTGIAPTY